jgi:hypothetical protein
MGRVFASPEGPPLVLGLLRQLTTGVRQVWWDERERVWKERRGHGGQKDAARVISSCIGIHPFALQHEQEERGGDVDSNNPDPFIGEGLSSDNLESDNNARLVPSLPTLYASSYDVPSPSPQPTHLHPM